MMKQNTGDCQEAYDELCCYTLAHGGQDFIHQHVVDAFAAQTADTSTKPISLTFALIGLYLHVEKGFSGKEVQRAHMTLARFKRAWPRFQLPDNRGTITAVDVMRKPAGAERDTMIHEWSAGVWEAFAENRETILSLLAEYKIAQS